MIPPARRGALGFGHFSTFLADHAFIDYEDQFHALFPDNPGLVGSIRVAGGQQPGLIEADPWSVADDACNNGPSA